jgi:hypothetical protein
MAEDSMCKIKQITTYSLEPADRSPEAVEELAFIVNALIVEGWGNREINNDKELIEALKAEVSRPREEREREAREIIKDARRRFREMKDR